MLQYYWIITCILIVNKQRNIDLVSKDFRDNVRYAIEILTNLNGSSSEDEVLDAFYNHGIDIIDAKNINVFLPIAFCRRLLPNLKFKDEYFESEANVRTLKKRRFSKTEPYLMVWEEVSKYFSNAPQKGTILKIAGRASEFHVINHLLSVGGKMEDIKFTPRQITW